MKSGQVYVIKPRFKDGPFKIGFTTRPLGQRFSDIQLAHFEELEILYLIDSDNPRKLEQSLHKRFRAQRIRGEWFAASRELHECLLSLDGIYSPAERKIGLTMPHRPWHASRVPTERFEPPSVNAAVWQKWAESGQVYPI
jgi:hypothetical protein